MRRIATLFVLKKSARIAAATVAAVASLLALSVGARGQSSLQGTSGSSSDKPPRYFMVRDSIEMSRFERGVGKPIFSPDGKYFAVVTSRGIIDSDEVESTLRVFKSHDVEEFLRNGDVAGSVRSKVIARLAAVPKVDYVSSYVPIISNVEWSDGSRTLLFLAENGRKERQLYRADLFQGSFQAVTLQGYDVSQFDSDGGTVAYRAATSGQALEIGEPINVDAREVSGVPLQEILFGERALRFSMYSELWVHRRGRNLRIRDASTKRPIRLLNSIPVFPGLSPLSVSPDGRFVVSLLPVSFIPESWESYVSDFPSRKFDSKDSNVVADSNWDRPMEYTLIDLDRGEVTSLLRAPHAILLGYGGNNLAVWSSDGKNLLLTNTFLPLDGVDEQEHSNRLRPCAAVVVDLASKMNSCVTFVRKRDASLFSVSFAGTAREVVLRFRRNVENAEEERYSYNDGTWQRVSLPGAGQTHGSSKSAATDGSKALSVEIRQDLNTPPALWATDPATGQSKKIWDPNPKLRGFSLGEASVFHWKDKTGHEWTGGLVKPPDYISGKRYPLVIQTHGFFASEFMSDGTFTTAFAARPLAAAGIVVLQVPDTHDHIETADEAPDHIRGYEAAIDSLAAEGAIDPLKVGIIGFSRTCYYVESALIQSSERFAAATIAEGVDESYIQRLTFFSAAKRGGRGEGDAIYGAMPFGEGLKAWLDHAPGFHLNRIQTPVRIEAHYPGSVLAEWEIYASLWGQGKPVDLIQVPDGQHILQKPLERMASQQGDVDWFRFWLKGEEDPDPAKAEQYKRWRELRKLEGASGKPDASSR